VALARAGTAGNEGERGQVQQVEIECSFHGGPPHGRGFRESGCNQPMATIVKTPA
jgi:hypothetical protein